MAQQRKRIKHTATLEERLAKEAIKFKEAAEKQPPVSTARELLLQRARQAETAVYGPMSCVRRRKYERTRGRYTFFTGDDGHMDDGPLRCSRLSGWALRVPLK